MTQPAKTLSHKLQSGWQEKFVAMLPAIQEHAAYRFRHRLPEEREELGAETVALACVMFARLLEVGKVGYATPLAVFACRQVAVGRRLGSPLNVNDVTSTYCRRRKGIYVQRLNRYDTKDAEWRKVMESFSEARTSLGLAACGMKVDLLPKMKEMAHQAGDGTEYANEHGIVLKRGEVKISDIYQGIDEREVDRVVLDVPEPWQAVAGIGDALVMGGIMLSFVPTILQVQKLVLALEDDGRFQMIESLETLLRTWHVTERSVRPDHRMIAHSGFLTTAVRCDPKPSGRVQVETEEPPVDESAEDSSEESPEA